jgi:molybdopterin-guanine dinucleotide biosynthesis protein A
MKRDKALIREPVSGLLLWERQLRLLTKLQPAEILWSGPARPGMPPGLHIVEDAQAQAGPLAGICACLQVVRADLLVVLAIDLPAMTAPFLRGLMDRCTPTCGAVVRRAAYFEPLAAVYPQAMKALAQAHLDQGQFALQDLLRKGESAGLMKSFGLHESDDALFKNVNRPEDL